MDVSKVEKKSTGQYACASKMHIRHIHSFIQLYNHWPFQYRLKLLQNRVLRKIFVQPKKGS